MSMEIDVLIEEGIPEAPQTDWFRGIAEKVLTTLDMPAETEMGLVITTQERITQLNRDYLKKDEPTDVISFYMTSPDPDETPFVAAPDGMVHLGEVIISYPQAVIQAGERGHAVPRELTILIIHGILHLLGYEDEKPELKETMAAKEAEILSIMENG
jgi:probable rRNA maturation factor